MTYENKIRPKINIDIERKIFNTQKIIENFHTKYEIFTKKMKFP